MASSSEEKYDVFISFRGVDTRDNFMSHLYTALRGKKIETYVDYRLERGGAISPQLLRAIEASKLSVIIFSENYASSSWCLDELVHILKSNKLVLPVFYNVDPSTVRKQSGSFRAAFSEHETRFRDEIGKVQKWRKALEEAANLAGWDSTVTRPESVLVDEVVKDVLKKLRRISPSSASKGLVGIDERVETLMQLLSVGSSDVRVLGLWGMGGIGKTTLAHTLYNRLLGDFEGGCFLTNVREESDKLGLINLRNKLLSELLGEEVAVRNSFDEERLSKRRVIVVLDDVKDPEEMKTLVGVHDCFGPGSRIILTSRDEQVLQNATNLHLYEVRILNYDDSLKLFQRNAFKNSDVPSDFKELSLKVVDYAKGVPLALKILGSCLCSKTNIEWERELNKLNMVPNLTIHNVLRISYDGLDATEKDIFLDIACFFKGEDRDLVEKILDGCGLFADVGIPNLIKKSLISVENGSEVYMHDLLQEMGREIVRQESKKLGKRSRLWVAEDILRVLKTNTGSDAIEGLFLDMSKIRETDLDPSVFAKMHNLRLLKVYNSNKLGNECKLRFPKGLESLPDALSYFHWYGYPLKSFPADFSPENLVVLEMPHCQVERLWNQDQCLGKLRVIDLSSSENLNQFPDLSQAPYLDSMNLSGNANLKTVTAIPESVKHLTLNETGIEDLPSSIGSLNNLITLALRNCKELKRLPSTTQKLHSLKYFDLHGCSSLSDFPVLPMNISRLNMNGTAIEQVPPQIEGLSSLRSLDLGNCEKLKTVSISDVPLLGNREEVSFVNCVELDQNSRHEIMADAQHKIMLSATAHRKTKGLHDGSQFTVCCPGNGVPSWFSYRNEGNSINIELSPGWLSDNFSGFALCVAASFKNHTAYGWFPFRYKSTFKTISGQCCGEVDAFVDFLTPSATEDSFNEVAIMDSDHVFLWYDYNFDNFINREDEDLRGATEASFEFYLVDLFRGFAISESCYVKKCGVRLLYA